MACLNCGADRHTIMSTCALNASPHVVNEGFRQAPPFDRQRFNEQVRASLEAWKARRREPLYRRVYRELQQAMQTTSEIFGNEELFERACALIRVSREQALEAIAEVQKEQAV